MKIVAAACLLTCACTPASPPNEYPLSARQVYDRLVASDLNEFKLARQCGILIHIVPDGMPSQMVRWRVFSSGKEMFSFSANLTPLAADRTRVDLDLSKAGNGREDYDGSQFYPRPAVLQPVRPSLEEAIDAVLDGRSFDPSRIPPAPSRDSVCLVQRGGLESGSVRFSVDDEPGMDSDRSGAARAAREEARNAH